MHKWQEQYQLLDPKGCTIWDDPPPECVERYRVYFDNGQGNDPYRRGIVVEQWKDGRYYFLDSNFEKVGTLEEVEDYLRHFLIREQYINEDDQILQPDGVTPVAEGPIDPESVQGLFVELFPSERLRIRGGNDIPLDSVVGDDCALTLRAAKALYERPEIEGESVVRNAVAACEVYING